MKAQSRGTYLLLVATLMVLSFCIQSLNGEGKKESDKGAWVDRPDGGKLNLLIEQQNFELHFFNQDGEATEPEMNQAILHYTSRVVRARESLLLSPVERDDKVILTSPRMIRPPYQLEVLLVLNVDGGNMETHHIIFRQEANSGGASPPPPPGSGR